MKKVTLYFIILLSIFSLSLNAQEADSTQQVTWKKAGSLNFSFANVGLSNWAAGGQNSISVGTILDLNAVRTSEKSTWENNLKIQYGMARVGKNSTNLFKKTDDSFIFTSKYGYKLKNPKWSITQIVDFRSQMAPGYLYSRDSLGVEQEGDLISKFLAPGYLLLATGIEYKTKNFSINYAPLTAKFTFVTDDALAAVGAFGVDPGKKSRSELGSSLLSTLEFDPMENVKFKSSLSLFANYETTSQIDVGWETLLVFKVNKYLTTSFGTHLIYDHDILITQEDGTSKRAIQFKNVLNVNVGFVF
jgi:hypothetical protein